MTDVLLCCICVKAAFQTHQAKHTPFKKNKSYGTLAVKKL